MKKREKNTKRTPRFVAQTLVVSLLMGTAVPTSGLGRVVYASESNTSQTTQKEASEGTAQATSVQDVTAEAVITVGEDIISSEVLDIINEVQAKKDLEEITETIEEGEKKVDEALDGFDEQIADSKEASEAAKTALGTTEDEADKATEALEEAKKVQTSTEAKEQATIAQGAAQAAQGAADEAKEEAQNAKDAYVKAEEAYNTALKEAEDAKEKANAAIDAADENAEKAAQVVADAEAKAEALKAEVEAAREKAEEHFTEKEAALSQAQQELETAKENLDKAAANEEVAREELKTATEAVLETGSFLLAAEAYETLSTVTVEGLEFAIFVMEEAKAAADQALLDAEAALKFTEGNKEKVQEAYDAALAAYNTANATLEQANSDLEKAKAEQEEAGALAESGYGQKLAAIEKELLEANNAGDTAAVEAKTQELITTVIMYDQDSDAAKYNSVTLIDSTNKIYKATDAEGKNVYYRYTANEDGGFSFFECNVNTVETTVKDREVVTELPSFEGKNDWEYDVLDLGNGSYEVIYYDVIKVNYTLVDNTADDSYANVTNRVTAANEKYQTATGNVETATLNKKSAEEAEKVTASALATAEGELAHAQKTYDRIEALYDSYYGNKKETIGIPFIGEVEIEIPGTSQYVKDKAALELAKLAAQENLKAAQAAVAKCREEHSAAVANLGVKAAEYSAAVQELACAALEVGKAELKVGAATIDLAEAREAFEACKAAEEYAALLEAKVEEARIKAEAARDYVDELRAKAEVGSEELAAAEAALSQAEEELQRAEEAAAAAQVKADEAKAAYDEIAAIVAKLVEKENAVSGGSSSSGNSGSSDSVTASTAATQQDFVTIEEEGTPLSQTFDLDGITYIDVTPELIDDKLMENVLHKYYGQNVYLLAHMGDGFGFTIAAENIIYGAGDLDLSGYMELVENFEEGFVTKRFVPHHPTKLSYEIGLNMHVGAEFAGKTAYLFTKNLETGVYEFQMVTEVSEIGNVMVNTKSLTRTIAMIME